jgi:uncharacterized Zn finger protein
MSWYYQWRPYVPVAQRRANAARELAKLARKTGRQVAPVILQGRTIASTFWGKAWCDNLEAYSDFANRLPRGRSYVRNGSVVDLQISPGRVAARVSGSELYRIEIKIKPLPATRWKAIQTECAGQIDSLIELLQGKLSSAVMRVVTQPQRGLFPAPKEIELDCSCPDWAGLCKHVAASLYGVGARLDQNPALLFRLRGVDPADLISKASATEAVRQTTAPQGAAPAMSDAEVAEVFGIELAPAEPLTTSQVAPVHAAPAVPLATPAKAPAPPRPQPWGPVGRRRLSAAARARLLAAAKARWQRRKQAGRQRRVPRQPASSVGRKAKL